MHVNSGSGKPGKSNVQHRWNAQIGSCKKNKDGYLDFTSCNKFVAKLQIFQDIPVYQEIEKSVDALNTGVCLVVCNNGLTLI